jgi:molecular chaperone DnaJ
MPDVRGSSNGDEFVKVTVVTPTKLTNQQKELMKQLGSSLGDHAKAPPRKSVFSRFREDS